MHFPLLLNTLGPGLLRPAQGLRKSAIAKEWLRSEAEDACLFCLFVCLFVCFVCFPSAHGDSVSAGAQIACFVTLLGRPLFAQRPRAPWRWRWQPRGWRVAHVLPRLSQSLDRPADALSRSPRTQPSRNPRGHRPGSPPVPFCRRAAPRGGGASRRPWKLIACSGP